MARFAPVMPVQLYQEAINIGGHSRFGPFGDYHLLLAHDVLQKSKEYANTFKYFHTFFAPTKGPQPIIIMDNSVVELGDSVTLREVDEAANIVNADVLVIPDVLESCGGTINRLHKNMDMLPPNFSRQLMFVPQGQTLASFTRAMEASLTCYRSDLITWWGLPRLATKYLGTRLQLIALAKALAPHRHIHLLGFSDYVLDDILCARAGVDGIDSAVPVRAGQKGDTFLLSRNDYGKRGDYWDQPNLTTLAMQNIRQVRKWVAGRNFSQVDELLSVHYLVYPEEHETFKNAIAQSMGDE